MKLIRVLIVSIIVVLVSSHMEIEIDFPMSSSKKQGNNPLGIINKMIENIEEEQFNSKNKHKSNEMEIIEVTPMNSKKPQNNFPSFLNSPFFNMNSKPSLVLGPIEGFEMNPFGSRKSSSISNPQIIEIETIIPNKPAIRKKHLRAPPVPKSTRKINKQFNKIMMDEIDNEFEDMLDDFIDDIEIPHKKLKKHSHNPPPMKKKDTISSKKANSLANSQKEVKSWENNPSKTLPTKSPVKPQIVTKKESPKTVKAETSNFSKIKETFNSTIQGFNFAKHKHHIYMGCYIIFAGLLALLILYFALSREKTNSQTELKFMNDIVKLK